MKASVPYHELLIKKLEDPEEARVYLEVALEEFEADGDKEHFLVALFLLSEFVTMPGIKESQQQGHRG